MLTVVLTNVSTNVLTDMVIKASDHAQVDGDKRCVVIASTPLGTRGAPPCCGFGTPCNQGQGGAYAPGEAPLCRWTDDDREDCSIHAPVLASVCPTAAPCPRFLELQAWVARAAGAWERHAATQALQANTMVFNAFIFMQARRSTIFETIHVDCYPDNIDVYRMVFLKYDGGG